MIRKYKVYTLYTVFIIIIIIIIPYYLSSSLLLLLFLLLYVLHDFLLVNLPSNIHDSELRRINKVSFSSLFYTQY